MQPAYAVFCVPPGQLVVVIFSAPPVDVSVTIAEAVTDPAALVAVRTYVVVVSGLTFTVPLAEVDARFPGAMLSVVAPEVVQLSVLIPPNEMLVGLAVNELIVGRLGWVTVTTTVAVAVPVVFVAVSVYVVVAVGLRTTDPLADVDAKVPGVTATPVAPVAVQFRVVVEPAMIDAGLAENVPIVGAATCLMVGSVCVQPASPMKAGRRTSAQKTIQNSLSLWTPDCNS